MRHSPAAAEALAVRHRPGGAAQLRCACGEPRGIFADIRSRCPAIREVYVPDDLWPRFDRWHNSPDPVAQHRSILVLALERAYLPRLTSPVHQYLFRDGKLRPELTQQYRRDLREQWMFDPDPERRHSQSKIFMGKVTELQVAQWLDANGWSVTGLEAIGGGPDVEAIAPDGQTVAFEVKHVGIEDNYFRAILESLAGRHSGQSASSYDAANYLLFRVYEAARQLGKTPGMKVAVVAINDLAWDHFELQLRERWIDWSAPKLYDSCSGASPDWEMFMRSQDQHPRLHEDLAETLDVLDEVWVFHVLGDLRYERELAVPNQRLERTRDALDGSM